MSVYRYQCVCVNLWQKEEEKGRGRGYGGWSVIVAHFHGVDFARGRSRRREARRRI